MSLSDAPEPPGEVSYTLDEALELLGALEEARDALITTHRPVSLCGPRLPQPSGAS